MYFSNLLHQQGYFTKISQIRSPLDIVRKQKAVELKIRGVYPLCVLDIIEKQKEADLKIMDIASEVLLMTQPGNVACLIENYQSNLAMRLCQSYGQMNIELPCNKFVPRGTNKVRYKKRALFKRLR